MKLVSSVNGVPIRLTPERFGHIAERHPEMAREEQRMLETLSMPDLVQQGDGGALIAIKHYATTPLTSKYCVVVYREVSSLDGFILTAYFATQPSVVRRTIWTP